MEVLILVRKALFVHIEFLMTLEKKELHDASRIMRLMDAI